MGRHSVRNLRSLPENCNFQLSRLFFTQDTASCSDDCVKR